MNRLVPVSLLFALAAVLLGDAYAGVLTEDPQGDLATWSLRGRELKVRQTQQTHGCFLAQILTHLRLQHLFMCNVIGNVAFSFVKR